MARHTLLIVRYQHFDRPVEFTGRCNKSSTEKPAVTLESTGSPDTICHETPLPSFGKNNNESNNSDFYSADEDDYNDIPVNSNRPPTYYEDSTSDSEDDC